MSDEKNWLAADYVLGVLRGAERQAFEKQLSRDGELAQLVVQWQQRLELVDQGQDEFCPGMSDAEVDLALNRVFDKICAKIEQTSVQGVGAINPLKNLSKEQVAGMRPIVSRLIASYLVLIERLKIQQAQLAAGKA